MKTKLFMTVLLLSVGFIANAKNNAMYKLDFELTVGAYKLNAVEKITIEKSQEMLSHSCIVTIPGMARGQEISLDGKLKRGDKVVVNLGYNKVLKTEFTGYLKAIYPGSPMRLEFEDSIYLLRRSVTSKLLKNATAKDILNYVLSEINPQLETPFVLKTDISGYKWDRFVINEATGYEVIDRLRKDSGLTIYTHGNELHCHLAFTQKTGQCVYDLSCNVERTDDLQYVESKDVKVLIKVIGRTPKGAKLEVEVGERGGSVVTLQRPTITDRETLLNIGNEEAKKMTFDGYRGKIRGWLIPYCSIGYSVKIVDPDYKGRQGIFYVTATKVEFSKSGGVRTVSLGAKIG